MQIFAKGNGVAIYSTMPQLTCSYLKNIVSPQVGRIMKLTGILLLAACLHVSAKGVTQTVNLSEKDAPLQKVIKAIEAQTDYVFFYKTSWLQQAKRITIKAENIPLKEALDLCFKGQPLSYIISGKNITIEPKEEKPVEKPTIDISGKITDKDGNPLVGANVKIKGTNTGTTTKGDGSFFLKGVEENSVLEISYVGFETQLVSLQGRNSLVINLNPKNSILDETIVIAYGTTTNRLATGNVSKVKASEIEKQPVNNPLLALQGRVPGMTITQTSGMPGSGVVVRIQGQNSLNNGNGPLYVVDGVPISTELPSPGSGYGPLPNSGETVIRQLNGRGNTLNYINPSDIESIEILKDADATSIYGSRAANGAILITTKKGKAGKTALNVDVQQGWGQVTRTMDLLNTNQYLGMRYEALKNNGLTPSASRTASGQFIYAPDLMIWDTTRTKDWQKELIGGTSQYTNANASISGGSPSVQYLAGVNYRRETSVFPGDFSNRRGSMHVNVNNSSDLAQKFHFQISSSYLIDDNRLPSIDFTSLALRLVPTAPDLYNSDGSLNWAQDINGISTWVNPLSNSRYRTYSSKTNNLIANTNLSYDLLPGLKISTGLGYTNLQSNDYQLNSLLAERPENRYLPSTTRTAYYGNSKLNTWIIEPQATYRKNIGQAKLDVLLGSTFQQTSTEAGYLAGSGYNNDEVLKNPMAAASLNSTGQLINLYKYNALYSRINYNWKNKYILNLTGRRDGSSRFGGNNKFHNFWSVGGGWIFTEEALIKNWRSFFSFGKIKGNYGTTGSDQIGEYRFLTLYNIINQPIAYQNTNGLAPGDIPNPYLQWEETKKLSIGVDLGFIDNRIFLTANYGQNKSSNQLIDYRLPVMTGRVSVLANFPATVQNTSWEFTLNTENFKKRDFNWTTNINLTIPRNKLVAFPNLAASSYANNYIIGEPVNIQKLYPFGGVDANTGLYTVLDTHGNPTASPNFLMDRTILVSSFPRYYGGVQNTFNHKGIELSFLFQFVKQIAPSPRFGFAHTAGRFFSANSNGNQPTSVLDRWQKAGDVSSVQKFVANTSANSSWSNALTSDASYEDASYVRLKNISLSWELPASWKQKVKMQNFRLYVQGQNLLTITNYKGLDPETASYSALPPLKVITFGLQVRL